MSKTYFGSVNLEHVAVTAFGEFVENYKSTCKEFDVGAEYEKLLRSIRNDKLNHKASIGLFANHEGEVDIVLICGTHLLFFMLILSLLLLSHQKCNVEWLLFALTCRQRRSLLH